MWDLEQIFDLERGSIAYKLSSFSVLRLLNQSDVPENIPTNFFMRQYFPAEILCAIE